MKNLNVVNEYDALVGVLIYKSDIDILTCVVLQGDFHVSPLIVDATFGSTRISNGVVNLLLVGFEVSDSLRCDIVVDIVAGRDEINFEYVLFILIEALNVECQAAVLVGEVSCGYHHPVVAGSCGIVGGVRHSGIVATLFVVASYPPGCGGGGETVALHLLGGDVVVTLVEHHLERQALVEVLREEIYVVVGDFTLVVTLIFDRDSLISTAITHICHYSCGHLDVICVALIEVDGRGGIECHLVTVDSDREVGESVGLIVAVDLSFGALYEFESAVEVKKDMAGGVVKFADT